MMAKLNWMHRRSLSLAVVAVFALVMGVSAMVPPQVQADGNSEVVFYWDNSPAGSDSWSERHNFAYTSKQAWWGDNYFEVSLDGAPIPWQLVSTSDSYETFEIHGSVSLVATEVGEHNFCVTTASLSSAPPIDHCLAFAVTGDSNYEAAKEEAKRLAAPEVDKALTDCRATGKGFDFCTNSSEAFQGILERWYRCRYGAARVFGVSYDSPRITEVCGQKPVYKPPPPPTETD